MKHVGVDIVTGFLGSGKTTLLRRALDGCLREDKVAVVVNEIGDIGIDGRTIKGMEYLEQVVELTNGCICCSIDEYRFDLAIQELVETLDPTLVVIESTGLADPDPMIQRVKQAGLGLDAVITVVDAAHVARALHLARTARRQIARADFLVVNKTDLMSTAGLGRVRRRLARLNGRALTFECKYGDVTSDLLFATSTRHRRREMTRGPDDVHGSSGDHMAEDGFESFSYRSELPVDRERFERFLDRLPSAVYRAKGFVRVADNPWSCLFNFTCGRYDLNWVKLREEVGGTQAVFIGAGVSRFRRTIEQRLAACHETRRWS